MKPKIQAALVEEAPPSAAVPMRVIKVNVDGGKFYVYVPADREITPDELEEMRAQLRVLRGKAK